MSSAMESITSFQQVPAEPVHASTSSYHDPVHHASQLSRGEMRRLKRGQKAGSIHGSGVVFYMDRSQPDKVSGVLLWGIPMTSSTASQERKCVDVARELLLSSCIHQPGEEGLTSQHGANMNSPYERLRDKAVEIYGAVHDDIIDDSRTGTPLHNPQYRTTPDKTRSMLPSRHQKQAAAWASSLAISGEVPFNGGRLGRTKADERAEAFTRSLKTDLRFQGRRKMVPDPDFDTMTHEETESSGLRRVHGVSGRAANAK